MFGAGDPQVTNPSPSRVALFRCQGESDHRIWFVPREVTLSTVDPAQESNDQYNEAARRLASTLQGYTSCRCLRWLPVAPKGFAYRPVRAVSPSKTEKDRDPVFAPDESGQIVRTAMFRHAVHGPMASHGYGLASRDVSISVLPGEAPSVTAKRFVIGAEQNCSWFNAHRDGREASANEYCLNFTGEFQSTSFALSTPAMENFYVQVANSEAATPKP